MLQYYEVPTKPMKATLVSLECSAWQLPQGMAIICFTNTYCSRGESRQKQNVPVLKVWDYFFPKSACKTSSDGEPEPKRDTLWFLVCVLAAACEMWGIEVDHRHRSSLQQGDAELSDKLHYKPSVLCFMGGKKLPCPA